MTEEEDRKKKTVGRVRAVLISVLLNLGIINVLSKKMMIKKDNDQIFLKKVSTGQIQAVLGVKEQS